jgi:SagB-type dehydrogenase family enzyme
VEARLNSASGKRLLYRRSPFLVCYWEKGELVFENYATGARLTAAPVAGEILTFFGRWRQAADLLSRWKDYQPASLRRAVEALVRHSLLERSDQKRSEKERAMESWADWNPAAGFFHFSTKDVRFEMNPVAAHRALRERARKFPAPAAAKRYPRAHRIALAAPDVGGEFPRVLLARRTWRQFGRRRVELRTLGELLWLAGRVQRWVKIPGIGRFALKTSPSGGALHPIEIYVHAPRVAGLAPGLYHYDAEHHRLERLRRGATPRQLVSYLPAQPWYGDASALLLMTGAFARSQWKYEFARCYRAVLLDAGHLSQTFCLAATWLGLAPFCTLALADSRIEQDLGVDGVTESVLFAVGIGSRPPGVDWAPWPKGHHPI